MKAILMSIRPEHLVNILNGIKTIELRTRFPKDYRGWVYLYCTKDKKQPLAAFRFIEGWRYRIYSDNTHYSAGCTGNIGNDVNGKVVCRFWVGNVEEVIANNNYFIGMSSYKTATMPKSELLKKACVNHEYLYVHMTMFGKTEKAIHISKLEIFDKPKELAEFYYYKKRLIDCGIDCPPYFDEVKTQVRRAPQSWQYIYIEEDK